MKVIHLLRHAKSRWDDPVLADHERPLVAPRAAAPPPGSPSTWRARGSSPALVLCSSSRRTRQTLELVAAALPDVPARVEAGLYGAGEGSLLRRVRRLARPGGLRACSIGHNPGLQDLALTLAGGGDADALARLRAKMPTAALATLAMPVTRWRALRPARSRAGRVRGAARARLRARRERREAPRGTPARRLQDLRPRASCLDHDLRNAAMSRGGRRRIARNAAACAPRLRRGSLGPS